MTTVPIVGYCVGCNAEIVEGEAYIYMEPHINLSFVEGARVSFLCSICAGTPLWDKVWNRSGKRKTKK